MESQKSFRDLKIWHKADIIFDMVCRDIRRWPSDKIANSIAYQLIRAAGSIGANIAEGYGRGLPGEFEQFLRYARGSAAETDNWLNNALKADLITGARYEEYTVIFREMSKMIGSFIGKLRLQPHKKVDPR